MPRLRDFISVVKILLMVCFEKWYEIDSDSFIVFLQNSQP